MNPLITRLIPLLAAALGGCVLPADESPGLRPQPPVYEFGFTHTVIQSDSMPRLQGDSLYVDLSYNGCAFREAVTLHYAQITPSTYEVWLNKEVGTVCAMPVLDKGRAFKIPDEIKNATSVTLVARQADTDELVRINLIKTQGNEDSTKQPVYDFGDRYELVISDSMPRLQGDSLYVDAGHMCSPAWLVLEHFQTGDSTYEVWLNMPNQPRPQCAIPVVARHAFKLPDEIGSTASVHLVAPGLEGYMRIELRRE